MGRNVPLLLFTGLVMMSQPLVAHHSGSMWDAEQRVTLQGPVTEVNFANPHVRIYFETTDKAGGTAQWIAVSASPQRLYRTGWNSKTLREGDLITVTGIRARDGRKLVNIRELIGPKGQTLFEGAD